MCMSQYAKNKKERLENLKSYIKNEGPLDHEKVVAETEVEHGVSKEKVEEYLDTLIKAGYIYISDGEVHWMDDSED